MTHRVIMRVHEAIKILEGMGSSSAFYKELQSQDPNKWLVQVDIPDKNGKPKFFILEDTEENARLLMQHKIVDLNSGSLGGLTFDL